MKETPLPFHDDHLVVLIGQDELLGRAGDEIGDDAIDRAAAAGHQDAGLARGHEGGVDARLLQAPGDLHGGDHLAAAAIVGDRYGCGGTAGECRGAGKRRARRCGGDRPAPRRGGRRPGRTRGRRPGTRAGRKPRSCRAPGPPARSAANGRGSCLPAARCPAAACWPPGRRPARPRRGSILPRPAVRRWSCPPRSRSSTATTSSLPVADDADGRLGRARIGVPVDQDHHATRCSHGGSACLPLVDSTRCFDASPQANRLPETEQGPRNKY